MTIIQSLAPCGWAQWACLLLSCVVAQPTVNSHVDEYHSSDEEHGKKVAQRKYEQFQLMCGDLLDPSKYLAMAAAAR